METLLRTIPRTGTLKGIEPHRPAQETFGTSPDGHFVGEDGFVVPKDFVEFYERNPMGVRRWLRSKVKQRGMDDLRLELEQELLLYLYSLPDNSKHREKGANGHEDGCTDVIQCFDPVKQHGASAKRFHNFINLCLTNRLSTLLTKQSRDALHRKNRLRIVATSADGSSGSESPRNGVDDRFLYRHSTYLASRHKGCRWSQTSVQTIFVQEFKTFVRREAPQMLAVLEAIANTGSFREASESLGISVKCMTKHQQSLQSLKNRFLTVGNALRG